MNTVLRDIARELLAARAVVEAADRLVRGDPRTAVEAKWMATGEALAAYDAAVKEGGDEIQ